MFSVATQENRHLKNLFRIKSRVSKKLTEKTCVFHIVIRHTGFFGCFVLLNNRI